MPQSQQIVFSILLVGCCTFQTRAVDPQPHADSSAAPERPLYAEQPADARTLAAFEDDDASKERLARAAIASNSPLRMAIKLYQFDCGDYPVKLEHLVKRPTNSKHAERWQAPFLKSPKSLIDPWGTPYQYKIVKGATDKHLRLWSCGPDCQSDTVDDIVDESLAVENASRNSIPTSAEIAKTLQVLKGHERGIDHVACSPDGEYVAVLAYPCTIKIWNLETGEVIRELQPDKERYHFGKIAFNPDGNCLVATMESGTRDAKLKFWGHKADKHIQTVDAPFGAKSLSFSPNGKLLARAGVTGPSTRRMTPAVWIHDATTGDVGHQLMDKEMQFISSACFSPDSKKIAAADHLTLYIWDVDTGELLLRKPNCHKSGDLISWSPNGKNLALAGGRSRTITICDAETGEKQLELEGHKGSVKSLTYLPNSDLLISGGNDKSVRIWNTISGDEPVELKTDHRWNLIAIDAHGRKLIVSDIGTAVKVWTLRTD